MTYRIWADDFSSSDMTGVSKYVAVKPNKNILLRAVRTQFLIYNDPVFTSLNAKIYSADDSNAPQSLLYSSTDVRTKAEIHTLANGVKETYFTFADIPMQENTFYCIVINGTGYLPTDSSFIGWKCAFPDPIYSASGFTYAIETINRCPFEINLISGDF